MKHCYVSISSLQEQKAALKPSHKWLWKENHKKMSKSREGKKDVVPPTGRNSPYCEEVGETGQVGELG